MVESVFGMLFVVALAGTVLAVISGAVLLAWPVKKASRPFVAATGVAAHV